MITSTEIIRQLDEALKTFGKYSFEDKGAREVMDLDAIVGHLSSMTSSQAGTVMKEVAESHDYGQNLINEICGCLDDKDEDWFEDMIRLSGAEY